MVAFYIALFYLRMSILSSICILCSNSGPLKFLEIVEFIHRVTVERTSLSKETYTVKNPQKIFASCDVFRGIDAGVCRIKWF